jgi:hypothetical protein
VRPNAGELGPLGAEQIVMQSQESSAPGRRVRPLGTWLVLVFYVVAGLQAALVYTRGEISLANGRVAKVHVPVAGKIFRGGLLCMKVFAAIQLFFLRRRALRWFLGALMLTCPICLYDLAVAWQKHHRPVVLALLLLGEFAVVTASLFYAQRLERQGWLTGT